MVLVSVIADGAQIVVSTFGAFPTYAEYGLLSARVAHCAFVLYSGRSAVQYAQIELARAAVIRSRSVVPDYNYLIRGLEVPYSTNVTLASILKKACKNSF